MIKENKTKLCSECGRFYTTGGNSFYRLCRFCNHKRLNKDKVVKTTKRKKIRKPTGEAALFKEIWEQRPHVCANCRDYLGKEARAHYFAHIKPKSTHPELRLDPDNVMLLCSSCHFAYDFQGQEAYEKRKAPLN